MAAERLRRAAVEKAPLDHAAAGAERRTFQRRWFGKFESLLHAEISGSVWLKEERVAELVLAALHHRAGRVYRLDAFSIMPNHVHTVFAPLLPEAAARKLAERAWRRKQRGQQPTQPNSLRPRLHDDDADAVLSVLMQSLKGYTARQCNLALGRSGAFWQHESFDHVVREQGEFGRIVNYVLNNPVKARLVSHWQDWQWNYCRPALIEAGLVVAHPRG